MVRKQSVSITVLVIITTLIALVSVSPFARPKAPDLAGTIESVLRSSAHYDSREYVPLKLKGTTDNASLSSLPSCSAIHKTHPQVAPLKLELLGVVVGKSLAPLAFIKDAKTQEEHLCGIGDVVSGARIVIINLDGVLVKSQGRGHWLRITGGRNPEENREEIQERDAIRVISPGEREVSKSGVLTHIGGNLSGALSEVRVRPHGSRGKIEGFVVDDIREGSIVEEAGFQNGDIIKTVNGQAIDSFQKGLQVFRKIKNQATIKVNLARDNQPMALTYLIRE